MFTRHTKNRLSKPRRLTLEGLETRQLMTVAPTLAPLPIDLTMPVLIAPPDYPCMITGPVAKDDLAADNYTEQGNQTSIHPLENDDPGLGQSKDSLRLIGIGSGNGGGLDPQYGTATIDTDLKTILYVPKEHLFYPVDKLLVDSFSYTMQNADGSTSTAIVSVANYRYNRPPAHVHLDLGGSDLEAYHKYEIGVAMPGQEVTPTLAPQHGKLDYESHPQNPRSAATFTPDDGFLGSDVFRLTIRDRAGFVQEIDCSVVIRHFTNPNAKGDTANTSMNQRISIDVLANDFDPDGDAIQLHAIRVDPQYGTVRINPQTQQIVYTPKAGFVGDDQFTYNIIDSTGRTDKAVVRIHVSDSTPDAPTGLRATHVSSRGLELNWRDNSQNEQRFSIEASTDGQSFHRIGTADANATSFQVTDLSPGTNYWFRVRAVGSESNSPYSEDVSVKTASERPNAPVQLSVGNVWATKVDLDWSSNSPNVTSYVIQISRDGVHWDQFATVGGSERKLRATGLAANTNYKFRVLAESDGLLSEASNVLTLRTAKA